MWDYIKWIPVIITIYKTIKAYDFTNIKHSLSIINDNFKYIVNHSIYASISIVMGAFLATLLILCGCIISMVLFVKTQHLFALAPLVLIVLVSLNMFYQTIKLYK